MGGFMFGSKIKKYNILPTLKLEVELQSFVTPLSIKTFKEVGLLEENVDFINSAISVALNLEQTLEFLEAIFVLRDKEKEKIQLNLDKLDMIAVMQGYADFFVRLNPPGKELMKLMQSLSFLATEQE
jgi:hypothetical protein